MGALSPGLCIDGWHILEGVHQGHVGRVFTVFREGHPEQLYALKLLREDRIADHAETIQKEAKRLKVTDAPDRMPRLVETGSWMGLPYFVMERLDEVDYPIPDRAYRAYCVDACEALADLHRADIIHCDITTIHLVRKNGRLAFIDFDNAHTHMEAANSTEHCIGTDPYIAPEVADKGMLSEQSDIYSLAYVLRAHCPPKLVKCFGPVLEKAMSRDPEDRPGSAAELAERLRTCRTPHRRFRAVCWAAAAVAAVFVVSMVGFRMFRYQSTVIRNQQRIDEEGCFRAAVDAMKCKDWNGARKLIEPIAAKNGPRQDQAVKMLEDIRQKQARRRTHAGPSS